MLWPSLFEEAFRSFEPRLERVITFASCRESWLQAEMCLFLRDRGADVSVNSYSLGGGCKVDFHATSPSPMVAEMKLLGNGYAPKCFDGTGKLHRFQPTSEGGRVRITTSDVAAASGYFLYDCARLGRIQKIAERYMILVVDRRGTMDRLGHALLAAQVSDEEWTIEPPSRSYLVRVWHLPPTVDSKEHSDAAVSNE
jgi:hypothetical protein